MSKASRRTDAGARDRAERLQSWIAALLTALLHLLMLLAVMLAPPITVTASQDGAAGSPMEVTYIDETLRPPSPPEPSAPAPAASRLQTTLVTQADDPAPLQVVDIPDSPAPPVAEPPRQPQPTPAPPDAPDEPVERPAHTWGQPPGMLPQNRAPVNAGRARSPAVNRSRGSGASSGTSLEVGGYQVYYDLLDEARLRAWRDQGMTELFLPLPGTRRLMVCPLEIALHRDSGACRLVEPDDPELEAIGDARDVITMQRVYRLGEVLWRGPGAYR